MLEKTLIEFAFIGPPVPKQSAPVTRRGITYTPRKSDEYAASLKIYARELYPDILPEEGAMRMQVGVYLPIPKSWPESKRRAAKEGVLRPMARGCGDWDDYGKMISGALEGIFFINDSQIVSASVEKFYSTLPRISVLLQRVGEYESA